MGFHAESNASYSGAENMLQVFEMQSILRYGAGADDVDSRRSEPLVDVLFVGFEEGQTMTDERALMVGEGVKESLCWCHFLLWF